MTSWLSILQTCGGLFRGWTRSDAKDFNFYHDDPSIHEPASKKSIETAPLHKTKSLHPPRPTFADLPLSTSHPKASAWGLWGRDDELGTLNLLTPEVVSQASSEIYLGHVMPLNLPLDSPRRAMNPLRKRCVHRITAKGHANDDELDLNTQSSSHWDGLRHYPYQETLQYYNGVTQADITGATAGPKIGIQSTYQATPKPERPVTILDIAQKGIAGRGVLLDWRAYALRNGIEYSPFTNHSIPLHELLDVAKEQNITFKQGDILIIRSGWMEEYKKLSDTEKEELGLRKERAHCGVEASEAAIKWHWDMAFAAVAGDTVAYESWPPSKPWGVAMHEVFLSGWGMPIGETWDLETLAMKCREHRRWTFFFTSQPLHIVNGVASPANAMAIL